MSQITLAMYPTVRSGSFKEVGEVGVDARDNVYVFDRDAHPVTNSRLPGERAV
jgi:hypothetical protein